MSQEQVVLIQLRVMSDGRISENVKGTMAPANMVYGLLDIILRIFAGQGQTAAPPVIPGMLKRDGSRVRVN